MAGQRLHGWEYGPSHAYYCPALYFVSWPDMPRMIRYDHELSAMREKQDSHRELEDGVRQRSGTSANSWTSAASLCSNPSHCSRLDKISSPPPGKGPDAHAGDGNCRTTPSSAPGRPACAWRTAARSWCTDDAGVDESPVTRAPDEREGIKDAISTKAVDVTPCPCSPPDPDQTLGDRQLFTCSKIDFL